MCIRDRSNMEWSLAGSLDAARDSSGLPGDLLALERPLIRTFKVPHRMAMQPQRDLDGGAWLRLDGPRGLECTAVGYFFAARLQAELDVPIGLVDATWGGTPAESWTPIAALTGFARHASPPGADAKGPKEQSSPKKDGPSSLWNGMVAPIVPFSFKGVIWYQGEANREHAAEYETLFPALIGAWRNAFAAPLLPFLFVQIAPFNYGDSAEDDDDLGRLRLAQARALELPAAGMAVTADIGNPRDIHPKNKWTVGERLALQALAKVYGRADIHCEPPTASEAVALGSVLEVKFDHAHEGLEAPTKLRDFELSADGTVFHRARARLSETGTSVLIDCELVPNPRAARYLWSDENPATLFGSTGLPTAPFWISLPDGDARR